MRVKITNLKGDRLEFNPKDFMNYQPDIKSDGYKITKLYGIDVVESITRNETLRDLIEDD